MIDDSDLQVYRKDCKLSPGFNKNNVKLSDIPLEAIFNTPIDEVRNDRIRMGLNPPPVAFRYKSNPRPTPQNQTD